MSLVGDQGRAAEGDAPGAADRSQQPPPPPSAIESYIHTFRTQFPSITGSDGLVAWVQQEDVRGYLLACAFVSADLKVLKTKVMPELGGVVFERDVRGNIISIRQADNVDERRLVGTVLERLNICFGASLKGNQNVVFNNQRGQGDSGLVIPKANCEHWTESVTRQDGTKFTIEGYRIYTGQQIFNLSLPKEDVKVLVENRRLEPVSLPPILKELSNLRKVDQDYDIAILGDLDSITEARGEATIRRAHSSFLNALEAAYLDKSSIDEKVTAFVRAPSFQFIMRLGLKRPFSKPLFDVGQKPVAKRSLSSLPADSKILLQDLKFDGNFYERQLNANMQVYVPGDYRIKAGRNNFRSLGTQETMTAGQLRQIIAAKEKAGGQGVNESGSSEAAPAGGEKDVPSFDLAI
jgi:hypothetical protein